MLVMVLFHHSSIYITRIGANPALTGCAQILVMYTTPKNLEREKVF